MKLRRFFMFIMLCIMGALSAVAFFSSNMFDAAYFEFAYFGIDKIWLHLLLALLLTFLFIAVSPHIHPAKPRRFLHVMLACSTIFSAAVSFYWAWICHYVPVWDPGIVCSSALTLASGQTLAADQLAYMAKHPYQLGLVTLFQWILRLFGNGGSSFMTLHYFMAGCIPVILLAGCRLCRLLFDSTKTCCYYLLLGCGCLPLFLYVNFIYSDIPGILLMLLSLDGLIAYLKRGSRVQGCLGLLCLVLATIIRKHTLIIVIAVTLIWFLNALYRRSRRQFAEALAIPVVVILCSNLFTSQVCRYYQVPTDKAAPSVIWIAMGMQESRFGSGWFNGYVDQQYEELHGDPDLLSQEAFADIRDSLSEFAAHPRHAVSFYLHKILIQWNQPSYQCLGLSKTYEEMPGELVNNIYFGRINSVLRIYFDCYQLLVYAGTGICIASCFIAMRHKRFPDYFLIPLLAILGGFLFSLLWEAKSRYIMPYFILMLPYAAKGIGHWDNVSGKIHRRTLKYANRGKI